MQYSNIAQLAEENENFRKVLFTNGQSQVVLMSIKPGEDIGKEVHDVDQILYFVAGSARAEVGGDTIEVTAGDLVDVPSGTEHNFINTGSEDLKLFTVYAPPEHPDGTIHATKAEAEAAEQ
jgi:mannose-6-phosphate isomerase-like protein (cupin superfamily)